jgi:23S rRNA (guanosine2251-2'-O)-methyltransferase
VSDQRALLEGAISVGAALAAASRPVEVVYLRQDKRDRETAALTQQAQAAGARVERVSADALDQMAQGKTHGGVLAQVGPRRFVPLETLAADRPCPFVIMLDGVEDPYNFGQAVRAFYAAGADGLVVRPRNWMSAASVVARASAGASELIPTAVCETAEAAADFARSRGWQVACADKDRAVSVYDADLTVPLFLLIGGEKRGVTRSFADRADVRLRIPYGRRFRQALDTTSASAVLAFEIMRQRGGAI